MTILPSIRKNLVAVGVGAAVVIGAGGAVAWAQTPGPTTTTAPPAATSAPSPTTAPKPGPGVGLAAIRAIARRAVHADLIVKDKGGAFVTVTVDRGTVSTVNTGSITLARPDGKQVTLTVTGDTKVHGVSSVAAVQTGKTAIVASRDGTATQILQARS